MASNKRDHLNHLRARNLRPGTIYQRSRTLERLHRHLGHGRLLEVTPDDLHGFLGDPARDLTPESRATEISHLRGFYQWAVMEHLIDEDPTMRIARPKLPRRIPRPMPTDDLQRAVDLAEPRIAMALYLAAHAGLRACEIAQLRVEHVQLDAEPPILIVDESKGGGTSTVPISPELADVLRDLMPAGGWLVPRRDGRSGQTKPWRVSQIVNRHLHSLGIVHTLHTARHWFGTASYKATGRDLRATQELMRHRSPVSTAGYTYVDPGHLVDAVTKLPTLAKTPTLVD